MTNNQTAARPFWTIIILGVVCGLAAGVLGAIATQVYIWPDFSASSELNLTNLNANNPGLVIRDAKKVVVNQDVKIAETFANIRPAVVGIFKEIATSSAVASVKPDYYKLDSPLFVGLIITSDGWVAGLAPTDPKWEGNFKNYVAISSDRRVYKIDRLSNLKNLPGDPLIFHLAGALNLPVKKIISRQELSPGQSLLVTRGLNQIWPTTLTSLTKSSGVASSDTVTASLELAGIAGADFRNSLVFDLAGDLAALISDDGQIIPAFSYEAVWSALSRAAAVGRPYLGVNYLELSAVKSAALSLDQGAWLYPSATQTAVLKDSPAQQAGLKAGDVITWVNNQQLSAVNDLADILSRYQPGDQITLTYWRAGQEQEVEVKLTAQP